MTQEDLNKLALERNNLSEEVYRLNNIINELEKWCLSWKENDKYCVNINMLLRCKFIVQKSYLNYIKCNNCIKFDKNMNNEEVSDISSDYKEENTEKNSFKIEEKGLNSDIEFVKINKRNRFNSY